MATKKFRLSAHPVERFLEKPSRDFTKEDIIKFIEENGIRMLNFHYAAEDERLKTLNFIINNREHLEDILTSGERVDGSSLFSYISTGSSDLYIVPRYKTAFLDPFAKIPTLGLLCSIFSADGRPFSGSPEYILKKAHRSLQEKQGLRLEAMGELEYYVILKEDKRFPATDQKGYHESFPFNKTATFRKEAMELIASCGGKIKYAHSEVGNFTLNGYNFEQNEIEFLPVPVEDAADQLTLAKWVLRNMAYNNDVTITFSPKITVGKAGSGLHVHVRLMEGNRNVMVEKGQLSDFAKKAIAGFLQLAPSLTAFGNTNPTSYFRLVPNQEAPTSICWGDRNRSVLVRVPLGWTNANDMSVIANPTEENEGKDFSHKQTVEFRCPDGSADVYLLLAGLTVAAHLGLEMDGALEMAENTYVEKDVFKTLDERKKAQLKTLPESCFGSAKQLEAQKAFYLSNGVFPPELIENTVEKLREFNDRKLRERMEGNIEELTKLVKNFLHCG